jgi:hypothetical protein
MNDTELDELLNTWKAPEAPESLRRRVRAGFNARTERPKFRWSWGKSLIAGGAVALLLIVTQAVPQTIRLVSPEPKHPYTVLSEFVRYADDGSPTIGMHTTSYNDQYGRETLLSRSVADNPAHNAIAHVLDAASDSTAPVRMLLLNLSPHASEMRARQAAPEWVPGPSVYTECSDEHCIFGVAHHFLPKSAANPAIGCADGAVVDRQTILDYSTVAIQLPLDGNRTRRTVWMAPALGCFALKVATEQQMSDGRFRLLSGKQALRVRLAE